MNDETSTPAGDEGDAGSGRRFALQKIYLRDASFESPAAPEIFKGKWQPELNVNISNRARQVDGPTYEVVLKLTVEARQQDKVAFITEVEQSGLFHIEGFEAEEASRLLGIICPDNLFPFAREEINALVSKGGFPQLLLQPINFEQLYRRQQQQQESQVQGNA
ncbi:MAG: protein-export chaperone SecB [Gammaproteobacteria bacterium]|nr:protein-export chaperone SecB [Gammaproteobacteria bacterium]